MKPEKLQLCGQRNVECVPFGRIPFSRFAQGQSQGLIWNRGRDCALSFSAAKQNRGQERKVRIKMKKLFMSIAMAITALVITGCGRKHESLVKEFYSVLQSKDKTVAEQFAKAHLGEGVEDMLNSREGRELLGNVKKEFGKIAESKDSPKLKIVKEYSEGDDKSALIEAQCAGTTLYFVVLGEKITLITTKVDVVQGMLKKDGFK